MSDIPDFDKQAFAVGEHVDPALAGAQTRSKATQPGKQRCRAQSIRAADQAYHTDIERFSELPTCVSTLLHIQSVHQRSRDMAAGNPT